tara:strand:+ start:195 stop:845 length:651 start_codon:yes stop_codon:yes gene_type:complete
VVDVKPEVLFYAKAFVGLMAITNPIGAIPPLLAMTSDISQDERRKTIRRCAVAVAIILVGAVWIGDSLLATFGIGVPAFRAGGGILIMSMSIAMLHAQTSHARQTPKEFEHAQSKEDVAIVPLAIPLIAGPGAISLMIVTASQCPDWSARGLLAGVVVLFCVALWIPLRLADSISERMGPTGLNVVTRVMGLILVAVGIQMLTGGLKELLPGLAGS